MNIVELLSDLTPCQFTSFGEYLAKRYWLRRNLFITSHQKNGVDFSVNGLKYDVKSSRGPLHRRIPYNGEPPTDCGPHRDGFFILLLTVYADCAVLAEDGRCLERLNREALQQSWLTYLITHPENIATVDHLKLYLRELRSRKNTSWGFFAEYVYKVLMQEAGHIVVNEHTGGVDFIVDNRRIDVKARLMLDANAYVKFDVEANRRSRVSYPHVVFYRDKVVIFDTDSKPHEPFKETTWENVLGIFRDYLDRCRRHRNRTGSEFAANDLVRKENRAILAKLQAKILKEWGLKAEIRVRNASRRDMEDMANRVNHIWTFSEDDIRHLPLFVAQLRQQYHGVSAFLWDKLKEEERELLKCYEPLGRNSRQVQDLLLRLLNQIIGGRSIHDRGRFASVPLRQETLQLLNANPVGNNLVHLNRLLLEDTFSAEFYRKQNGWGVESLFQPLIKVTKVQQFAERLTARNPDSVSADLVNRFLLKTQNALEAFRKDQATGGLGTLLQIGLSEIIAEDRRAAEMAGADANNRVSLDSLVNAYPGLIRKNPIDLVVVVFFDDRVDYQVYAYRHQLFHTIAWFPKPVGRNDSKNWKVFDAKVPSNDNHRLTFNPNTLSDVFQFDSIADFEERFPRWNADGNANWFYRRNILP